MVFSDFQCPYCKRFSEIMHQLTAGERPELQIIYRHRPLSIHGWARDAAELTDCVALQDKNASWKVHDFLFAHQEGISSKTVLACLGREAL
jgi:protein-disulfide isomerase